MEAQVGETGECPYEISFKHDESEDEVRQKYNSERDYETSVLKLGWDSTFDVFFELLKQQNIQPGVCFDGGCGPGILGKRVKEQFPTATLYGQDLSDVQLGLAKEKNIYKALQQGSLKAGIMEIPEKVQVAWFNGVFGYIKNPEIAVQNVLPRLDSTAYIFISMRKYQFEETLAEYVNNESTLSVMTEKVFASLPGDPEHTKSCKYYAVLLKRTA